MKCGPALAFPKVLSQMTRYYLALSWQGEAKLEGRAPHHFTLSTNADLLEFEAEYSELPIANIPQLVFSQELKNVIKAWNRWWNDLARKST